LRIEQGRYVEEKVEERLCVLCQDSRVEDEAHFMLECPLYAKEREKMWSEVEKVTGCSMVKLDRQRQA